MINAVLTVGFGAVAAAIGFGLSRRARDTEWRSDSPCSTRGHTEDMEPRNEKSPEFFWA
jgi:hypothetical protein